MSNQAGLLLPRSVIYPSINFDMMAGLRCGLESSGKQATGIKTDSIGIGADTKLIYAACEKLLFDGCTVIAGYVNPTMAEQLEPLFASANALFLALDAGYQYPSGMKKLPHVFTISLQGTLCCRILAKMAVADGNKSLAVATSFYDAGYRSMHAHYRGLEDEGGGVTFNHITKLKRSEFTIEPLVQHLQDTAANGLFASFCGDMMQDFFSAAASADVFARLPVYGSSFMGDEQWLAQSRYPGVDIRTCVTWASQLDNAANRHFIKTLSDNKQRANIFSLLGWEAAQVMAGVFDAGDPDKAIAALEGKQYDSPRGVVTIDAGTHYLYAPVYEAWIREDEATGNCLLEPGAASPYTEQQRKKLEDDINNFSGSATSWSNAYACLES